jgi:Zn-dependent protease
MFTKSYELFKVFGFSIKVDLSWIIIAVLVTWSLAVGFFPQFFPDLTVGTYWTMGVVGALGLFTSIVLHELGHALMARKCDMHFDFRVPYSASTYAGPRKRYVLFTRSADATIWNALTYALIGGLLSSTLFVLTTTPALYLLFERRRGRSDSPTSAAG